MCDLVRIAAMTLYHGRVRESKPIRNAIPAAQNRCNCLQTMLKIRFFRVVFFDNFFVLLEVSYTGSNLRVVVSWPQCSRLHARNACLGWKISVLKDLVCRKQEYPSEPREAPLWKFVSKFKPWFTGKLLAQKSMYAQHSWSQKRGLQRLQGCLGTWARICSNLF